MKILTPLVRWFTAPEQNALRWGVALSLLVHGLVLAWQPHIMSPIANRPTALDVVLVNTFSEQIPLTPQVIAQDNLEGGGEVADQRIASNPMPRVGIEDEDISLVELTRQRRQLEAEQQQLLKQLLSIWNARPNQLQSDASEDALISGTDEVDQQALEQNSRIAAILDQIERYNERPRRYYDAPSAIANPFAGYVDAWRLRVEQTGSQHYPTSAGQRPRGDLQASVTINANGSVAEIVIDRPAADARLNQAVKRIIELAQPFPPFPEQLAAEVDQLVITRTWRFTPGLLTTQVP
ncbi:TonB family protein [Orrella daihaiensis]|uniref:TonB family protein n=1 Tax=Orrella daihaiensis TaxID=2782176 RepID=A0ABY4AKL4_9BURK|nr:TonB family protein [Orrella daihaiensis]UOD50186.1 TonB family protein [Orrella daihaiensis]